jgi:hypothetical protein
MARRDRREIDSRLIVLLAHVLKGFHQPERRSGCCRGTVVEHRQELETLAQRGVLMCYAEGVLADAYKKAIERAAAATVLPDEVFPVDWPYSLDQLLDTHVLSEDS